MTTNDTSPIEVPERLHDKIYLSELENILIQMAVEMKDLDPEYKKVINEHFWELA